MARVYEKVFYGDKLVPLSEASLSVASSAVLYGLSVYTVFPVSLNNKGQLVAFRLQDHFRRLTSSAKIIGIDTFEKKWNYERFVDAVNQVVTDQKPTEDVFVRATIHVDALVAGTRSRGLSTVLSMFLYEALPIIPQDGARLKTSVWRRIPDYAIPSRAKVNGAYVNSVLAKQDAIDSGYDDCIFLDSQGHVCELSAANIFIIRDGALITPDTTHDLLEGINRRTVIQLAYDLDIPVVERAVDLTELYIADEAFACGTSAFVAPIKEVDARQIGNGHTPITEKLRPLHSAVIHGNHPGYEKWLTVIS
ncbi:aminotransferase class IV [Candidatus Saccharibacteria bacterium]|nr:aminotransferase class IV [Candidatus Saccharibacteria bacterium]